MNSESFWIVIAFLIFLYLTRKKGPMSTVAGSATPGPALDGPEVALSVPRTLSEEMIYQANLIAVRYRAGANEGYGDNGGEQQ